MNIFLDTSSLIQLYHQENTTAELDKKLSELQIAFIYLSEITKIEFTSAVYKKVRTKEISLEQASIILDAFAADLANYIFIRTDENIVEQARRLCIKYGINGLRTLDSIQFATCIELRNQATLFITADKLLGNLLLAEGLPIR